MLKSASAEEGIRVQNRSCPAAVSENEPRHSEGLTEPYVRTPGRKEEDQSGLLAVRTDDAVDGDRSRFG